MADPEHKHSPTRHADGVALAPASGGVSVVILTRDEESNLAECLRSCAWSDDVHVVDSGSTDRTLDIARAAGATIHVNPFQSFGRQRNWAIDHVPHKYDWVFHLDADERFTPALAAEVKRVAAAASDAAGYYVPHKLIFMDCWLRRAAGYPVYQMRFFHRARMRFTDWGHGQRELTTGRIDTLVEPYLHYNFSKGLDEWIDKHNRYSTLEAKETVGRLSHPDRSLRFFGPPVERRRYLKERLIPRLPALWPFRFFWMYVLRGGWLDGKAGLYYCMLITTYQWFIRLKVEELLRKPAAAEPEAVPVSRAEPAPAAPNRLPS
jgi:glycosyltransferase involved in cell wall biosynthesis